MIDIQDIEKKIEEAKTQPWKVVGILIMFAVYAILTTYVSSYVSETAKQHAKTSITERAKQPDPAITSKVQTKSETPKTESSIEQHTEGDQSPAIVSDGDVRINFND